MKSIFISVIYIIALLIAHATLTFASTEILGMWRDTDDKSTIELIQGFKPNKGIAIIYEEGNVSKVDTWSLEDGKYKIGYNALSIEGEKIKYRNKELEKTEESRAITSVIELKKEPNKFIQELTDFSWGTGDNKEIYYFLKGFSNETGIYNQLEVEEKVSKGLGSWAVAKDTLKINDELYLEGKITDTYLILLDKNDRILFFNRLKREETLSKIELKEIKEQFISSLTAGTWLRRSRWSKDSFIKFRPVYGDLSGVRHYYEEDRFQGSTEWEYSLKTGSLKVGYDEYIDAQIQGQYLLLQKKDGNVQSYQRIGGEIEKFSYTDVKEFEISEKDTDQLQKFLENQMYKAGYTYQFIFKNSTEGYLHQFRTYPFVISGNKFKIQDKIQFENVLFLDNEITFGKNQEALSLNTNQVYLKHMSEEQSKEFQEQKVASSEDTQKRSIVINLTTKEGETIRVPLPVESLQDIIRFSIDPN